MKWIGFTGWMKMGASLRSNLGGFVNSPAVRRVKDAAMKRKKKCDEMFTQMGGWMMR